jgi:hypothetical protein
MRDVEPSGGHTVWPIFAPMKPGHHSDPKVPAISREGRGKSAEQPSSTCRRARHTPLQLPAWFPTVVNAAAGRIACETIPTKRWSSAIGELVM